MALENIHQKLQVRLEVYLEAVRTLASCAEGLGVVGYFGRIQPFKVMSASCLGMALLIKLLPLHPWKGDEASACHFRKRLYTEVGLHIAGLLLLQSVFRPLPWPEVSVLIGGYGVIVCFTHRKSGVDDYISSLNRCRELIEDHDRLVAHFKESDSYLDDLATLQSNFPDYDAELKSAFLEARDPQQLFSDQALNWAGEERLAIELLSLLKEPVCGIKRTQSLYRVLGNLDQFGYWGVRDVSSEIFCDLYGDELRNSKVLWGAVGGGPRGGVLEYREESLCDIHDVNVSDLERAKELLNFRIDRVALHFDLYLKLWQHPIGVLIAAMARVAPHCYEQGLKNATPHTLISTYCHLRNEYQEERKAILERLLPFKAQVSSNIEVGKWQNIGAYPAIEDCISLRRTCKLVRSTIGLFPEIAAQLSGPRRNELAEKLLTVQQQKRLQESRNQ